MRKLHLEKYGCCIANQRLTVEWVVVESRECGVSLVGSTQWIVRVRQLVEHMETVPDTVLRLVPVVHMEMVLDMDPRLVPIVSLGLFVIKQVLTARRVRPEEFVVVVDQSMIVRQALVLRRAPNVFEMELAVFVVFEPGSIDSDLHP